MKLNHWAVLPIMIGFLLMTGCTNEAEVTEVTTASPAPTVRKMAAADIADFPLKDDASLYSAYDPTDVVCFYITVRKGNAADMTDHTFSEVNSYKHLQGMTGVEQIKAEAIFQVGDENGPLPGEVGYGAIGANAIINVRGRTSTDYPQKSYHISLLDSAGQWRGQRDIALNKHPGDPTRLRNMLYFELLQDVPGMVSLRTQFVRVYVKDETTPDASEGFEDYGLFTQVELPNRRYLRNHGLSRDANLYKANICEMYRYPEQLRLADDPAYDAEAFSEVLESKTGNDHSKLLTMLDAVNDYTIPIEEVVGRYFDLDNLTSYLAFNMLMANPDSNAQNYLLYSPVNSEKWYYLCWDGDGSLSYYEDMLLQNAWKEGEWTRGVSDYWGVVLFNRMLRVDEYRQALTRKVEALHKVITPERIASLIARYRKVVDQYTVRMPDAVNMQIPTEKLNAVYENMPYDTDMAYEYYVESMKKPMPFNLLGVSSSANDLTLNWTAAYDFEGEFVKYDVQVASDWTFAPGVIVWESKGQLETTATLTKPAADTYYWRVIGTNEGGVSQSAFDQVETATGVHTGMRRFTVKADGTVVSE